MSKYSKFIVPLALIAGIACAGDAPWSVTVGTNSVMLVPARPVRGFSTDDWVASTTNDAGTVVKSGSNYYFTSLGGVTSTNAPTHTSGVVTDGTVDWRYVTSGRRGGVFVSIKTSGGSADFSFGSDAAVTTNGVRLVGEGHAVIFGREDNYQGAVYAISADGSDVVIGGQELPEY